MEFLSNASVSSCISVNPAEICEDFNPGFLMSYKGYKYYYIDLNKISHDSICNIIDACDLLERECWNPQTNFRDYIKKCHHLIYADYKGEIIGFQLSTFPVLESDQVVSIDEIMIKKEHQKSKVALKMSSIAFSMGSRMAAENHGVTHVVWMGISCNPRVISSSYRGDPITRYFPNSFNPSQGLINLQKLYIESNDFELVDEEYNFFIKNLFPGSNKQNGIEKPSNFPEELNKLIPPDFDCMERGDAFMYAVRFGKRTNSIASFLMLFKNFGFKFFLKKIKF